MKFREVYYKKYVGLRILATLIDYGIYFAVFYLYLYCLGTRNNEGVMEVDGLLVLPIFLWWFIYFPGTEALNQATPGHDICKLLVVRTRGDKITFYDALKRRIVDPIDIFMYGIPALICVYKTPKFQRLGDLLADTVVVKKSDVIETEVTF